MRECGIKTSDMERELTTTQTAKFTEACITMGRDMGMVFLTIKMETDMRVCGKMAQ